MGRDPAKSEKRLRKWVAEAFEDVTLSVERTEKLSVRGGIGRAAYATKEGQECVFGAGAYGFDRSPGIDDHYDTLVRIVYCGRRADFQQILNFLRTAEQ